MSEPIEEKGDGSGCRCGAYGRSECGCADADWTPKEVYRLRSEVAALEQKLLESEVRGGELYEALEEVMMGDGTDKAVKILNRKDNPSHYSSQVEAIGKAVKFVEHIQAHLTEGQIVICKICGKSINEIV